MREPLVRVITDPERGSGVLMTREEAERREALAARTQKRRPQRTAKRTPEQTATKEGDVGAAG